MRSSDEMIVETLEAVLGPGAQEAEAVVVAAADVVHGLGPGAGRGLAVRDSNKAKAIRRLVITEKSPTRAFSWLKAATTTFTFKTLTLCGR